MAHQAGGQFDQAESAFSPHVVTYRELITGASAVAQELLVRLK